MRYSDERRKQIGDEAAGKTIESLKWLESEDDDDGGDYWVMTFTDGSEISFRLMAELDDGPVDDPRDG